MNIENLCGWQDGIYNRYFVTLPSGVEIDTDCGGYRQVNGYIDFFKPEGRDGKPTGSYLAYAPGAWTSIRWGTEPPLITPEIQHKEEGL